MPIANVADAFREFKAGTSKHIRSRAQAIAVGLSEERRHGNAASSRKPRRKLSGGRSLTGGR